MNTLKERALKLADEFRDKAATNRDNAAEHRDREQAAFHADEHDEMAYNQAREYVNRGASLAYEEAEVRLRLLAAGIPEGV